MEPNSLPNQTMHTALSVLSQYYEHEDFPVLCYPYTYAEDNLMPIDKAYNLWVLDVHRIGDLYYDHLERLLRRSK